MKEIIKEFISNWKIVIFILPLMMIIFVFWIVVKGLEEFLDDTMNKLIAFGNKHLR